MIPTGVYVRQQGTVCGFAGPDAWVVLNPIEQSIKRKIESVGKPLRDWNINIFRGVLTGYNEAFIITTQRRNEILSNCKSEEERQRTDAIIRPILRGRDIKRYSYDWAGLWLIATFPSKHYDIEQYPAVKQHLLSFGKERLEQSGKEYLINGEKVKARKKTNNQWFETQDSISYWEDFSQPKIVWKRVGSILRFSYDKAGLLSLDSTYFAVGKNIEFICCVLNSPMGHFLLKDAPQTGTGDLLVSVQAVEPLMLPSIPGEDNLYFAEKIGRLSEMVDNGSEQEVAERVFDLYDLSAEERDYIRTNYY